METPGRKIKHQIPTHELVARAEKEIEACCQRDNIDVAVLRSASRRHSVSRLRAYLAMKLVHEIGLSLAKTARQLGLSTSAIAQIMKRNK